MDASLLNPVAQADRLIELGVHDLASMTADELRARAAAYGDASGLLVTSAPPSALAPLLRLGDREGFVVVDMTDVDEFAPSDVVLPRVPYLVHDLDRGDDYANRSPAESVPEIVAAGRTPLTLAEGMHWLLQVPHTLERNRCFMTPGSRRRKPDGSYDARTPALWISNGTGRDGKERKGAAKVGWCWWGNRHTWLGIASAAARS